MGDVNRRVLLYRRIRSILLFLFVDDGFYKEFNFYDTFPIKNFGFFIMTSLHCMIFLKDNQCSSVRK